MTVADITTSITDIKELDKAKLSQWFERKGMQPFRAGQVMKWVYSRGADSFAVMTDLSKETRELLSKSFSIKRLNPVSVETSQDGTRKYLFGLADGKHIESVLIPERGRYTLCVSSQVGCAQGCRFCLTARGGLERNLTRGEIISQVMDIMAGLDATERLTNIVFMGMGEPLANYRNVVSAIKTITDNTSGLGFARRKITVSTAGLVPKLKDLGRATGIKPAISLNAADNQTRSRLMPINRKYPIESLLNACKSYPLKPGDRITFEYILIDRINASDADALRLARLLRPIRAKINLIPFNENDYSDFRRPAPSVVQRFQEILFQHHHTAIVRRSMGRDISAACGQLKARLKMD